MRSAQSKFLLSKLVASPARQIDHLVGAYDDVSKAIRKSHGALKQELKDLSISILDSSWSICMQERETYKGLKLMRKAIRAGDIRSANYYRLAEAANSILTTYTSSGMSNRRKNEFFAIFNECKSILADSIEGLGDGRTEVHDTLEQLLLNFNSAA